MKRNAALSLIALPVLAASYATLHPGVSIAKTPLAEILAPTPFKQNGTYTVDPAHTFVGFDIGHLGLSRVQGRFDKLVGTLQIDGKDLSKSSVQLTMQTESVDTNVAPRDMDLRSSNFFDVAKYPEMTFRSTRIRSYGRGYLAEGDLSLKGVTKPVTISFKQYGPIRDPWGGTRIGILAEPLTIHRSAYGMAFDADTVSDDVIVHISLEATLNKGK